MSSLAHLCQNVGQFFTLPLATDVSAQTSLAELQSTLILGDLQQFHASLLIGSMSDDLTNQIANEFGVLGLYLVERKNNINIIATMRLLLIKSRDFFYFLIRAKF